MNSFYSSQQSSELARIEFRCAAALLISAILGQMIMSNPVAGILIAPIVFVYLCRQ